MRESEKSTCERLVEYARLTWDRGLTEGTGGNLSLRESETMYITPSTFVKHFLTREDIVVLDLDGQQIGGSLKPSSEYRMHLEIYHQCPDIKAVIHAHPVYGTAIAVRYEHLPVNALPEAALLLAPITYIPYINPGTDSLAQAFIEPLRRGSRTFILQNHGVTVAGKSIMEAFARLETLEFLSRVAVLSGAAPGNLEIPDERLRELLELFGRDPGSYRPFEN